MDRTAKAKAFSAVGAVVGAGFASGQEIDGFFARFGRNGLLGAGAAIIIIAGLAGWALTHPGIAGMPAGWAGRWPGRLWRCIFGALALASGGAMLAGAGELAALMLPIPLAYPVGLIVTLGLALLMARGRQAIPWVSKVLVGLTVLMALAGWALPVKSAAVVWKNGLLDSLIHGASYGGMNMALVVPLLALSADELTPQGKKQCILLTAGIMGALLTAGILLFYRHTALIGQTLPFIRMMGFYGRLGWQVSGITLYLALLTTACAALRSLYALLPKRPWTGVAAPLMLLACSALGFAGMVSRVYPVLGAGCLGLLVAAAVAARGEK